MQQINFNNGYKEYCINGDESKVIRFNPSDFGIIDRISKAQKNIQSIIEDMNESDLQNAGEKSDIDLAGEILSVADKKIKEQIDYILDSKVSETAFQNQSCLSPVNGLPLYERFLNSVIPVITKDIESEQKASQKRIKKYTK